MLYLLNDAVFDVDPQGLVTPHDARRFEALTLAYVIGLGRELFAEDPLLHRNDPERARRLAWLLAAKQPDANAALFTAPAAGCPPERVGARFASLSEEMIRALDAKARDGELDVKSTDRKVWKRLAA